MGIDIFLFAERRVDGAWRPVPDPVFDERTREWHPVDAVKLGRPYELFAVISGRPFGIGSRHTAVPCISEPRGLPDDMSAVYARFHDRNFDGDSIAASWFMVRELIDFDWTQPVVRTYYVSPEWAKLFREGAPYPEAARGLTLHHDYFGPPPEGTVQVSWTETVREYVGCSGGFIEDLLQLGPPDDVRIVFWFE